MDRFSDAEGHMAKSAKLCQKNRICKGKVFTELEVKATQTWCVAWLSTYKLSFWTTYVAQAIVWGLPSTLIVLVLLLNTTWLSLTSRQCLSGLHMFCLAWLDICAVSRLCQAVHLELYYTQPGAGIYISRSAQYVYTRDCLRQCCKMSCPG